LTSKRLHDATGDCDALEFAERLYSTPSSDQTIVTIGDNRVQQTRRLE
jgi:hypothetical protein